MEPTQTPQVPGTKPEPIPFEPVKPVLVMPKEVSAPIPVVAPEPVIPPQPIVPPPPAPAKKIVMPFVPPPPPPQKPSTSHKGIWITLLVFLLLLAACGAYVYYTLFLPAKVTPLTQQDAVTPTPTIVTTIKSWSDEDLRLEFVEIPAEDNSARVLSSSTKNVISQADADFLNAYFTASSTTPPLDYTKARAVVKNNSNAFVLLDQALGKKEYQCSAYLGEKCSDLVPRNFARLIALRATLELKDKKYVDAQNDILKIIALGRRVTKGSDEFITSLIGLEIEKLGVSLGIQYKASSTQMLALESKDALKEELRSSFKNVLRYAYTRHSAMVDYINDPSKVPPNLFKLNPDASSTIVMFHNEINGANWNATSTKQLLYASYKIAISNIGLACAATYPESKKAFTVDPAVTPTGEDAVNYVGKTYYSTTYASFDAVNSKFCQFDALIDSL